MSQNVKVFYSSRTGRRAGTVHPFTLAGKEEWAPLSPDTLHQENATIVHSHFISAL